MIDERAAELKRDIDAIRGSDALDDCTQWSQGIAAGIQQTVAWLLEPDLWSHPLDTISGFSRKIESAESPDA